MRPLVSDVGTPGNRDYFPSSEDGWIDLDRLREVIVEFENLTAAAPLADRRFDRRGPSRPRPARGRSRGSSVEPQPLGGPSFFPYTRSHSRHASRSSRWLCRRLDVGSSGSAGRLLPTGPDRLAEDTRGPEMAGEIELFNDGEGVVVSGDRSDVERFLDHSGLLTQAQAFDLGKLSNVLNAGAAVANTVSDVVEQSALYLEADARVREAAQGRRRSDED